ncbi:Succinate dehydrogenase/Fumarate reductase transmembrane subunit [Polystyrenella longa]|uniref:Succinate dehydrogenase/Fumarate reductase transmembrane subunit n=1 Tax=Polystyrenella longa TaxID=2528007 RepID=A0A518CL53_9PLAN|nr:succinate dehydrogenase cytochrome b subunit [Polystyrenella longa]QDU79955.1 Succinate dehydrogenase/Fumarate reductase transmembrane subunit [Polystyrenella longa]
MWLLKALKSSIGQKYVMAISGLLLCGFLVAHLAGNLLLYVGPEMYDAYAHKLHENEQLLIVAELGLFALFFLHIYLAFSTRSMNTEARGVGYLEKQSKIEEKKQYALRPQNWMFLSGSIILAYLILHLGDFKFDLRMSETSEMEPFQKAVHILKDGISVFAYIVGPIILAIHLSHGVQSSFQTLGWNHPKYNKLISVGGTLFAWIIGIGFASFPIWALFMKGD